MQNAPVVDSPFVECTSAIAHVRRRRQRRRRRIGAVCFRQEKQERLDAPSHCTLLVCLLSGWPCNYCPPVHQVQANRYQSALRQSSATMAHQELRFPSLARVVVMWRTLELIVVARLELEAHTSTTTF